MKPRLLFILSFVLLAGAACGMKGPLEKPAGPPPPSLYERLSNTADEPAQADGAAQ
ncbi:MAG: hypothetical protein LBB55_04335 [Zoogloeaceae bacterium]|jgi:predicted small lipoprotein YifL|nr:hypothetical protein [Zoogloeaceae bacterium]